MKSVFLQFTTCLTVLIGIFTATKANALQTNPQIRVCNQNGGEFVVVETADDQIGLCRVGSSYIGALDLVKYLTEDTLSFSVEVYIQGVTSCDPLGTSRSFKSLEGQIIRICLYQDGSTIELLTLQSGKHSVENTKLNQILGL